MRCLETDFVYLENPPAYEAVRDDFPWEVTAQEERARRQQAEPLVSRLSDTVKRAKAWLRPRRNRMFDLAARAVQAIDRGRTLRLVDIGCGSGYLASVCCERFAERGRDILPIGIELSPALAEAAEKTFEPWSGEVVAAPAVEALGAIDEGSIDIAFMASFLEHDQQPLELLRTLKPRLAADGCAVIKVPNFDSWNRRLRGKRWCGFRFPDHVNYFTPATLARLAKEAGYRVDRGSWTDRQPLSDNMYAVLRAA
ncbi:MAG: class I SAM-dependent methyltransferase [Planctomycetota bacterium]